MLSSHSCAICGYSLSAFVKGRGHRCPKKALREIDRAHERGTVVEERVQSLYERLEDGFKMMKDD